MKDKIIELENNKEYFVIEDIIYKNKTYLYVANIKDKTDLLFLLFENNKVFEVKNEKIILSLLKIIKENYNY